MAITIFWCDISRLAKLVFTVLGSFCLHLPYAAPLKFWKGAFFTNVCPTRVPRLLPRAVQQLELLPRVDTTTCILHPRADKKTPVNGPKVNK